MKSQKQLREELTNLVNGKNTIIDYVETWRGNKCVLEVLMVGRKK